MHTTISLTIHKPNDPHCARLEWPLCSLNLAQCYICATQAAKWRTGKATLWLFSLQSYDSLFTLLVKYLCLFQMALISV